MAQNFHPWTGRPSVKLHGLQSGARSSGRIEDVLDVVYWSKLRANRKKIGMPEHALVKDAFCDVSQGGERPNFSQPNAPVFTTSSCIYAFEKDVLITGGHQIQAIVWPSSMVPLSALRDSECKSLSGESFSVPLATLIQAAFVFNPYAPHWLG